jgi:hypothetical protein
MATSDDSIRSARPLDLEGLLSESLRQKVIYAGAESVGQPYLIVTEDGIALVGDESNVISLNPDFGINLSGRIALACMPDQISMGGGMKPTKLGLFPSGAGLLPCRSAAGARQQTGQNEPEIKPSGQFGAVHGSCRMNRSKEAYGCVYGGCGMMGLESAEWLVTCCLYEPPPLVWEQGFSRPGLGCIEPLAPSHSCKEK